MEETTSSRRSVLEPRAITPSFGSPLLHGVYAALGKEDEKIVALFRVLIVPVPFLSADYILVRLSFVHGAPGFFSPEKNRMQDGVWK